MQTLGWFKALAAARYTAAAAACGGHLYGAPSVCFWDGLSDAGQQTARRRPARIEAKQVNRSPRVAR